VAVGAAISDAVSYRAWQPFVGTSALIGSNPIRALALNMEAVKLDRRPHLPRRQLSSTLSQLTNRHKGRVKIDPAAADAVYKISASAAPKGPTVMLSRVEYLINSGRWREGPETGQLLANLVKNASHWDSIWLAVAALAAHQGDYPAAREAINRGVSTRYMNPPYRAQLLALRERLRGL
jgi:hypothetical protein